MKISHSNRCRHRTFQLRHDGVHDAAALQLLLHLQELGPDELADLHLVLEVTIQQREGLGHVLLDDAVDPLGRVEPAGADGLVEHLEGMLGQDLLHVVFLASVAGGSYRNKQRSEQLRVMICNQLGKTNHNFSERLLSYGS